MNTLTKINENILKVMTNDGVSNVIKPLTKEIQLFDCFVSGTYNIKKRIVKKVKANDKLTLKKEPDYPFDEHAIMVLNDKNEKIGNLQYRFSGIVTNLIDAGKVVSAKVNSISLAEIDDEDEIIVIKIDVSLVDF